MDTGFLLSIRLIDALSTRSARISNLGWQEKSVEFILVRATTVGDFVEQAVPAHANSCFNLGLSRISLLLKGSFVKLDDHLFVGSRVVLKFSHLWGESVQMGCAAIQTFIFKVLDCELAFCIKVTPSLCWPTWG